MSKHDKHRRSELTVESADTEQIYPFEQSLALAANFQANIDADHKGRHTKDIKIGQEQKQEKKKHGGDESTDEHMCGRTRFESVSGAIPWPCGRQQWWQTLFVDAVRQVRPGTHDAYHQLARHQMLLRPQGGVRSSRSRTPA